MQKHVLGTGCQRVGGGQVENTERKALCVRYFRMCHNNENEAQPLFVLKFEKVTGKFER